MFVPLHPRRERGRVEPRARRTPRTAAASRSARPPRGCASAGRRAPWTRYRRWSFGIRPSYLSSASSRRASTLIFRPRARTAAGGAARACSRGSSCPRRRSPTRRRSPSTRSRRGSSGSRSRPRRATCPASTSASSSTAATRPRPSHSGHMPVGSLKRVAAAGAGARLADAREQDAQHRVRVGVGADRRARVAADALLVDDDRRAQLVEHVRVRLPVVRQERSARTPASCR